MSELKQNVIDALDALLDSDELEDGEWLKINMLYHQLEAAFDNTEELED